MRSDSVRKKYKKMGRGLTRGMQREYGLVFRSLKGEDVGLCLPSAGVPSVGLLDYSKCQ